MRDGLTGLYNRRAFNDLLAGQLARSERQQKGVCLLLFDLDHFKKLNDSYGHPAGDAALRETARVLQDHLRRGDLAARYGGEEFVAILPDTDEHAALQVAERIRKAIENDDLMFEGTRIKRTSSIGVAMSSGEVTTSRPHRSRRQGTLRGEGERPQSRRGGADGQGVPLLIRARGTNARAKTTSAA